MPDNRSGWHSHAAGLARLDHGGNPLAMAVGNVVWDIISDEKFLAEVRRVSGTVTQGLKSLADLHPDKVEAITGNGLLVGLQMKAMPKILQGLCREKKLLVGVAGNNVLRLAPPLIITDEDVREAVSVIDQSINEWTWTPHSVHSAPSAKPLLPVWLSGLYAFEHPRQRSETRDACLCHKRRLGCKARYLPPEKHQPPSAGDRIRARRRLGNRNTPNNRARHL